MHKGRSVVLFLTAVVLSAAVPVIGACRPDRESLVRNRANRDLTPVGDTDRDSPVVARIGNREIRFEEVTSSLDALPVFVRMRYQAPERRLEFLEAFLEFQVIALAASSEGLAKDPIVVDELKRDLVSRYLRESVDSRFRVADIPESEVIAWFEGHRYLYSHPAQNRVKRIVVADPLEAARVAFRATSLVRDATGDPSEVFASLVKPPWVASPGTLKVEDLGFLPDVSGLPSVIPPEVAAAGAAMVDQFSIAGPVSAADGWSILFLAAKRPAADLGIHQARTEIASMILDERRLAARRALARSLRAGRVVSIDEDVLAGLAAEAESSGDNPGPESDR